MICLNCSEGRHKECPGVIKHPSHCDCQHRNGVYVERERIDNRNSGTESAPDDGLDGDNQVQR